MRLLLNWPNSANVSLHWKNEPHCGAREAQKGKKEIRGHRDCKVQKEKEVIPAPRVCLVLKAREVCPDLKGRRGPQVQKAKGGIPAHRERQGPRVREATPVLKAHRDLQGQRVIPVDPTRLQQSEACISELKK
jgi:hypothetical protein